MSPPLLAWIVTLALAGGAGFALGAWWARRSRQQPRADVPLREGDTRLPNRAAALDQLPRALSLAERRGLTVTLLWIVVDQPSARHDAQQRADLDLAHRLLPRLRTHEMLTHWGPGQFLLLLPDADVPSALVLASDLRQLAGAVPPEGAADAPAAAVAATSISIGVHGRRPHGAQDWRELAAEMVIAVQRVLEITVANGPGRIEIEP
ncbi:MAG: diguanylate cyclase [Pseudomonadota bacterium]|uniref:diguanylate cyclase n=1 Tax=Tepidimonas thermarum TaxID=335431 RepID=UPI00117ED4D5|nr:diguanylate cyclase [Tepidimonas thermarum]